MKQQTKGMLKVLIQQDMEFKLSQRQDTVAIVENSADYKSNNNFEKLRLSRNTMRKTQDFLSLKRKSEGSIYH